MRTHILKTSGLLSALGLFLCLAIETPAYGQFPGCTLTLPEPPGNSDVLDANLTDYPCYNFVSTDPLVSSWLVDVPAQFASTNYLGPIPAGLYPAWCVDENTSLSAAAITVPGTLESGALYSTCDPNLNSELPAGHPYTLVSATAWQEVNYILNHATYDNAPVFYWDEQAAINVFVGTSTTSPPEHSGGGYPVFNPIVVQALTNAALANASTWVPQCGDVIGAIWVTSPDNQFVMLAVPLPLTLTVPPGANLGCNPSSSSLSLLTDSYIESLSSTTPPGAAISASHTESTSANGCIVTLTFTVVATCGVNSSLRTGCEVAYSPTTTTQTVVYTWTTDVTPPVLNGLPPMTASYQCYGDVPAPPTVTANDTCSGPTVVNYSSSESNAGSSCNNVIKRTWTATDNCGNRASFTQTITVNDTTQPTLSGVPTGTYLGCNPAPASIPADSDISGQVSATDNCTPTALIVISVTHMDSPPGCSMSRTFTITATDLCGNVAAATVVYTWTTATLMITPPTGGPLGCNPTTLPTVASVTAGVTVNDSCSSATVTVTANAPVTSGCNVSQTFNISASDTCGDTASTTVTYTWTVATLMITPPTGGPLGCNPSASSLPTDASVKAGVTTSDSCSTATVAVSHMDTTSGCTTTRTFAISVSDTCGDTATATVVYTWTTATLTITGKPSGGPLGCNPSASSLPTDSGVKAGVTTSDSCSTATVTVGHQDSVSGCTTTRTFTISASDTCGDTATATAVYTWTTATLTITGKPSGGPLGCNPSASSLPTDSGVKAGLTTSDSCSTATVTVSHQDVISGCTTTRTFTISASDTCGDTATATVVYTWTTTTLTITPPAGGSLGCNPAASSLPTVSSVTAGVTVNDSCSTPTLTVTANTPVTNGCNVTQTFNISATDTCNDSASATVTYTWIIPPTTTVQTGTVCLVTNSSNFNGTQPPPNDYIWFNANFTASGVPSTGATVYFDNSTISFVGNSVSYNLPVPNAVIIFSPSATCISNYYYSSSNTWVTISPIAGSDEIFLSGYSFPVPANFPSGINPVNWIGAFQAPTGVTIQWKWGAAVFTSFTDAYNMLGVKAAHTGTCLYGSSSDHAGAPENYKSYVTGGARGGGGANVTGSWSGTQSVVPCSTTPPGSSTVVVGPVITCPANVTLTSTAGATTLTSPPPSVTGTATATQACSGSPTITYADTITQGSCPGSGVVSRLWTATDECGDTTSCTQIITVNCPSTTPPGTCEKTDTNPSNFNGQQPPPNDYIWFNASCNVSGVPSSGTTVYFLNSTITFSANNVNYDLAVPNAVINFSPTATCISNYYYSSSNTWVITSPLNGSDEIFLTGLAFPVPANFPGGINPVNWSGTFAAASGVSINWFWGAAVFTTFTTQYNLLGIKPAHNNSCLYNNNGDHAGSPENYEQYVTAGARGGGGSNVTGSWSGTDSVTPCK